MTESLKDTPNLDWIIPLQSTRRHTILIANPQPYTRQGIPVDSPVKDGNRQRWQALCEVLKRTGAHVVECDSAAPYSRKVFTRDPLVHLGNKILCGRFTHRTRAEEEYPGGKLEAERRFKLEQGALIKALEHGEIDPARLHNKIVWMNENLHGGNVIIDKKAQRIFLGYTPVHGEMDEETANSIEIIQKNSGLRVIPVAIENSVDFYHLDTFFGLDETTHQAYLYPEATNRISYERLKEEMGGDLNLIGKTEAENMVTNFICIGRYIILTNDDREFEERLMQSRSDDTIITPHKCGVESFRLNNGGVRCATNIVDLPDLARDKAAKRA